jgi:DNA mismatch endonuclease (patch repair protein)
MSNKRRDRDNDRALREQGWEVLTLWECELKNAAILSERLVQFLATG